MPLSQRSNIDPVAHRVAVALLDNVAKMNTDTERTLRPLCIQLQEHRLRGRSGSRPIRLISLGIFRPRPISRKIVRLSVLR
jgi:hypothetical protein